MSTVSSDLYQTAQSCLVLVCEKQHCDSALQISTIHGCAGRVCTHYMQGASKLLRRCLLELCIKH